METVTIDSNDGYSLRIQIYGTDGVTKSSLLPGGIFFRYRQYAEITAISQIGAYTQEINRSINTGSKRKHVFSFRKTVTVSPQQRLQSAFLDVFSIVKDQQKVLLTRDGLQLLNQRFNEAYAELLSCTTTDTGNAQQQLALPAVS